MGYGAVSTAITILTAIVPAAPPTLTTTINGNNVHVEWQSPSTNAQNDYGAPITAYNVQIQAIDGISYFTDLTACNGTSSVVVTNLYCDIPISTLLGAPFNLVYGSSVYARSAAINIIGSSLFSTAGNGAVIAMSYAPDAPVNLTTNF